MNQIQTRQAKPLPGQQQHRPLPANIARCSIDLLTIKEFDMKKIDCCHASYRACLGAALARIAGQRAAGPGGEVRP
jgi:hypothetical protein